VDLKRRLERLGPARPRAPGGEGVPPGGDPGSTAGPARPEPDLSTLEALRQKMAAILGRPPVPRAAPIDPSLAGLPFTREETPHGPLFRRLEPLRPSRHVGRMPLDAARAARGEVLALLALDPELATTATDRAVFFDTETTGLGGVGSVVFLFGALWFDPDGGAWLEQLLLRQPGEELPCSTGSASSGPGEPARQLQRQGVRRAHPRHPRVMNRLPALSRRGRTRPVARRPAPAPRAARAAGSPRSSARSSASCAAKTSTAARCRAATPYLRTGDPAGLGWS
jgi:hypothetical protein